MEVGGEDIAFLQYTGGTTGVSKGAVLTHRNLVANTLQVVAFMPELGEIKDAVVITALPLYHIFALTSNMLVFTHVGGNNVLITNPRDMPGFVKELAQRALHVHHRRQHAVQRAAAHAGLRQARLQLAEGRARRRHGGAGGGLASAGSRSPAGTSARAGASRSRRRSAPRTCRATRNSPARSATRCLPPRSSIRDDDGNALPVGSVGEICMRGPQVMRGYWNRPEETAKVMLPGGWLRTGDIGRMDERGRTFIEDRKKDMILVSGFNVYPNEVEGVVAQMPACSRSRPSRRPDEQSGEVVALFIVKKDPALTAEEVDRLLQARTDRLQGAEGHLFPRRAAEDQRRQDPAPHAARRAQEAAGRVTGLPFQLWYCGESSCTAAIIAATCSGLVSGWTP